MTDVETTDKEREEIDNTSYKHIEILDNQGIVSNLFKYLVLDKDKTSDKIRYEFTLQTKKRPEYWLEKAGFELTTGRQYLIPMKQPRGKAYYNVVDKFIALAKEYDTGIKSSIPEKEQVKLDLDKEIREALLADDNPTENDRNIDVSTLARAVETMPKAFANNPVGGEITNQGDIYDRMDSVETIPKPKTKPANDKPLLAKGKRTDSSESQLVPSQTEGSPLAGDPNKLELNIESIMILNPKATKQNAMKFLQKCIWQNLNPFIGDCYLITYNNSQTGEQDMSMVVSKDVFLKRSSKNDSYEGFEAGIIVQVDKKLDYREGSVYIKGDETLIGGWAKVYVKGLRTILAKVLVGEYHSGKSLWNSKPATMIRKVALSQAMREAYPNELQGMYDRAEIDTNE